MKNSFYTDVLLNKLVTLKKSSLLKFVSEVGSTRYYDSGKLNIYHSTVIITPDIPCVIEHYLPLIARLEKLGFRVVCFDMLGGGFSRASDKFDFSIDKSSSFIKEFLNYLDLDNVILAFSCVNGLYALNLASIDKKLVKAVLLTQTPSLEDLHKWANRTIPNFMTWPYIGQIGNFFIRKKLVDVWYDLALSKSDDNKQAFKAKSLENIKSGGCFCLSSVVQGVASTSKDKFNKSISNISQPITLIWGESDYTHRFTSPDSLKKVLPEVKLVKIEEGTHFSDISYPDVFIQELQFLINNKA